MAIKHRHEYRVFSLVVILTPTMRSKKVLLSWAKHPHMRHVPTGAIPRELSCMCSSHSVSGRRTLNGNMPSKLGDQNTDTVLKLKTSSISRKIEPACQPRFFFCASKCRSQSQANCLSVFLRESAPRPLRIFVPGFLPSFPVSFLFRSLVPLAGSQKYFHKKKIHIWNFGRSSVPQISA